MHSKASITRASTCAAKVRVWAGRVQLSQELCHFLRHAVAEMWLVLRLAAAELGDVELQVLFDELGRTSGEGAILQVVLL